MKYVMAVLLLCGCACAQEINWEPCEKIIAPMRPAVEKFNANRTDGLGIWLTCQRGESAAEKKAEKPERHIALTTTEISTLHNLREQSDAAWKAQAAYEEFLIKKHGIRKPDIGEPCWRYVGIKMDDDFITDDQNPAMPFGCHQPPNSSAGK